MTPGPISAPASPNSVNVPLGCEGVSIRDYFAAAALTGLLANFNHDDLSEKQFVGESYTYADAMLAERAKART